MVVAFRSFLQAAGHLQQDATTAAGDASTGRECYIRKEPCLSAIAFGLSL